MTIDSTSDPIIDSPFYDKQKDETLKEKLKNQREIERIDQLICNARANIRRLERRMAELKGY